MDMDLGVGGETKSLCGTLGSGEGERMVKVLFEEQLDSDWFRVGWGALNRRLTICMSTPYPDPQIGASPASAACRRSMNRDRG